MLRVQEGEVMPKLMFRSAASRTRARKDGDWINDISLSNAINTCSPKWTEQAYLKAAVCPGCKRMRSPRQFLANPKDKESRNLETCHQCRRGK